MIKSADNEAVNEHVKMLKLEKNQKILQFFNSMCGQETGIGAKQNRLDKDLFKGKLTNRYSSIMAERMSQFIEAHFTSLYKADFGSYVKIIIDML